MCRRKRHIPDDERPGLTRCGHKISEGPYRLLTEGTMDKVTCKTCKARYGRPRVRNKSNNIAMIRDGKRLPYSSIESLERPLPPPDYGHSPKPGPPYPWEITEGMGCTGD